jgi:hypothetical protein
MAGGGYRLKTLVPALPVPRVTPNANEGSPEANKHRRFPRPFLRLMSVNPSFDKDSIKERTENRVQQVQ